MDRSGVRHPCAVGGDGILPVEECGKGRLTSRSSNRSFDMEITRGSCPGRQFVSTDVWRRSVANDALIRADILLAIAGQRALGVFVDFAGFLADEEVRIIGVEAAGAASLGTGRAGVLHGARSSLLADQDGQIADAHSISAGLDYPGVGPEHAFLRDTGRAEYLAATDEEALAAFHLLAEREGIIPALEPAHALARALDLDADLVLVGLSGRGDKDLATVLGRE